MFQGTPGDGTALIAGSSTTAGTVAAQVHAAQAAVESAQGKTGFVSRKAFHNILLTGCRMTVFNRSGLQRRTSLK